MRRPPAPPGPSRRPWRAAWVVGAALLVPVTMGWGATSARPAAASTSTVSLVDDRGGAGLFAASGLRPGATETACVALSVTGPVQSTGEVTLSAEVGEDALAPYLFLTVERGSLADPTRCASFTGAPAWSGTLADLPRAVGAGVPTGWRPDGAGSATYRISVTLLDDPRAQGRRAAADFVWALDVEPRAPEPPPVEVPDPVDPPAPVVDPPAPVGEPAPAGEPVPVPAAPPGAAPDPSAVVPAPAPPSAPPPVAGIDRSPRPGGDVLVAPPLQTSPSTVEEVVAAVGETAVAVARNGQFPLALVAVMAGFLVIQGRLDRRDPKLALAPERQDLNDFQTFPPTPRTAIP